MNDRLSIPSLTARLMPDNSILIRAVYESREQEPSEFELKLKVCEEFGGRTFEEWFEVAVGSGRVDADWLDV